MMELDNNDKLLRDFLTKNKQEIADSGFSHRVIRHLSGRSKHLSQLWTAFAMAIGTVLFVWLGGLEASWVTLRNVCISTFQYQEANLDPKSLVIVAIVLLFLGTRKVISMD